MSRRNRMKVPADYNDSMQSDSDDVNNAAYIEDVVNAANEPPSPVSSQVSTASRRRERAAKSYGRQASFDAAHKALTDKRNRLTIPTQEEDDDEISRSEPQPIRKKKSITVIRLVLYGHIAINHLLWTKWNAIIVRKTGRVCPDPHQHL